MSRRRHSRCLLRLKKSMSKKEAQKIKDKLEKEKRKKKKKEKEKREKKESGEEEKKTPSDILFIIQTVADILKSVISGLSKYLRIKFAKIYVKVGTPDAATTAIAYGAITQGINVIMPLLEQTRNFSQSKNCKFNVEADFTSEECTLDLRLVFSIRVWQILKIALSALLKLIKHFLQRKE